jgi:RNA polymerase sigma factor (sigma-70 family)
MRAETFAPAGHDAAADYRRLLAALGARARRLGSRDPEAAAQEALKRSLENAESQSAIEYYFSPEPPMAAAPPDWPLDRLFAWLHGVLQYVIREEQARAGFHREVGMPVAGSAFGSARRALEPADPSPGQLRDLIDRELRAIVAECVPKLEPQYRTVLSMRDHGLKYGQIASRLGVGENTVATWISRAIRDLARCVRKRTGLERRETR